MRIDIPQRHRQGLSDLIQMSRPDRERLIKAVHNAGPSLDERRLADVIAKSANLQHERTSRILRMLLSLVGLQEDEPLRDVVTGVCEAAHSSGDEDLHPNEEGGWDSFKEDLESLLSPHNSLALSRKASHVMLQHSRVFFDARFLSDIRPVFRPSLDETPAAMLVHTLKLTYREGDRAPSKNFFVALDAHDLRQLRGTIDRAIQKESMLKSVITASGMEHLEVEED